MPHVAFVPFTGLRIREAEMLELGMSLPGLRQRAAALAELPALGLLTLAGMTPDDWTQSYHEAKGDTAALVDQVADQQPTLVAVSALTASIQDAYDFCDRLRERGLVVVIGGLHATVCPEEVQRHADAVVVGEGEPVWHDVLNDAEAGQLQRRYHAAAAFDLALAPVPRFELLGSGRRPRWTLQTERGCPLACDFCGASRLLGSFREKPVANVTRELQAMNQVDAEPWLELADDNTFADRRDSEQLLSALGASGARYFTEVDWRIGERPELLRDLAASGCVQVLLGIESLSFRYPGMGAKAAEIERIMDAVRAIQAVGIVANGCFIVGAEGETHQSMDRLASFINASELAEVQLTLQTPFPGTQLHRRLQHEKRLLEPRDWSSYTLFDVTYQPDQLTPHELEQGFRRVLQTVFSQEAADRRSRLRRNIWKSNPRFRS
jgi:radical SAM superfamily enzyme YgiQ (UPF0313 family)